MNVRSSLPMLVTVGVLAGACGTPVSTKSPQRPPVTGTTITRRGGTLSIAFQGDIQSFDPAIAEDAVSVTGERLGFEALLTYGRGASATQIVPLLAAAMPSVSPDSRTYTFTLRQGVDFVRRDGTVLREMTAQDVADSIDRVLSPRLKPTPSPVGAAFFGGIVGADAVLAGNAHSASGIRVIGRYGIEITLQHPDRTFLNVMASPVASVVPVEVAAEDATAFSANPVGTGPYYLNAYDKGQKAVYVRNEHYWRPQAQKLDSIEIRLGVDDTAAVQQVEAGQLDIAGDPIPAELQVQTVQDPRFRDQVKSISTVETTFVEIDTKAPRSPLDDVRVRRALNEAVDKDRIVELMHGAATAASCIFPPSLPGYDPSCRPYSHDPADARTLLAAAGVRSGFSARLFTDTSQTSRTVAQSIQQDFADVGLKVDVVSQSFDALVTTITTPHAAPLATIGWFEDYPDPSDFIDPLFTCAATAPGAFNASEYCNPAVDNLAGEARGEQDDSKRLAEYRQAQKMIMADAPVIPLVHDIQYTIISKRVTDFAMHPVVLFDLQSYGIRG